MTCYTITRVAPKQHGVFLEVMGDEDRAITLAENMAAWMMSL